MIELSRRTIVLLVTLACASTALAQSAATAASYVDRAQVAVAGATGDGLLKITSPADGAVVNPGQTLMVTVASPDHSTFSKVVVLAEGIGVSDAGSSLPAQVSLAIPAAIACRKYLLSAMGATTSGLEVSTTIQIDVERRDKPVSISAQMRQLIFEAVGESGSIDLLARFADRSVLDVRESSNVAYASSDTGVATVDPTGIVTAIGAGHADVTATYGPPGAGVSVRIPVTVPPPLGAGRQPAEAMP